MDGIVGIAGTPGTGKKSVAPLVARSLGLRFLALNDLARILGAAKGSGPEVVVDTKKLRAGLEGLRGPAVVYGHLLPYSVGAASVSRMAVLRCEPAVLRRRLEKRGYSFPKVVENVEAELIGLESSDAFDAFGRRKTFEVDTTGLTPAESAGHVVATVRGKVRPPPRLDWMAAYATGAKLRSLLSAVES